MPGQIAQLLRQYAIVGRVDRVVERPRQHRSGVLDAAALFEVVGGPGERRQPGAQVE